MCPVRLTVRTSDFRSENISSTLIQDAKRKRQRVPEIGTSES